MSGAGRIGDVHRAATDDCAAAGASAEFRQGHPNRHRKSLSSVAVAAARMMFRNRAPDLTHT
jgi:hypothetical protein